MTLTYNGYVTYFQGAPGGGGATSDLLRRQNAEKLEAERALAEEEQAALDKLIDEHDKRRRQLMQDMEAQLNAKLTRGWS